MTILEDIRIGDIMLLPDGTHGKIEQCSGGHAHVGDDQWLRKSDLRNPEFRKGDMVRMRNKGLGWTTPWSGIAVDTAPYALVERAAKKPEGVRVLEKRAGPWKMNHEGSHVRDDGTALYRAVVSRVGDHWSALVAGGSRVTRSTEQSAKDWCDARLKDEGWVLEDAVVVEEERDPYGRRAPVVPPAPPAPRCTLCGHATPRYYASCEHNPEPKGTLISTLGWSQPAPIVVLAQNEEDVP